MLNFLFTSTFETLRYFSEIFEYKLAIVLWLKHNESELRYYAPNLSFCSSLAKYNPSTAKPNLVKIIFYISGTITMPTSAVRMGKVAEFKFQWNPNLFFVTLSRNCLTVYDYCVDSGGCEV